MATRNIVPRETGEGNIGTLLKKWLKGFFNTLHVAGNITDETNNVTVANLKTAYDHSQATHDKTFVGLGNVDNTSDANKPISSATQTALNAKANSSSLGDSAAKNVGTIAGTVAAGDDSRLTNTRTPTDSTVTFLKLTGDIKQWLINNGYQSADQQIAPHIALPNNFAIANTAGIYSEFVKLQRFNWDPTNGFASTVIHPAFTVDSAEKEIFIGKFQGCALLATGIVDNTNGIYAGSRKNVQQKSSITFDAAQTLCEANNNGTTITGFHLMTNAEWAA